MWMRAVQILLVFGMEPSGIRDLSKVVTNGMAGRSRVIGSVCCVLHTSSYYKSCAYVLPAVLII